MKEETEDAWLDLQLIKMDIIEPCTDGFSVMFVNKFLRQKQNTAFPQVWLFQMNADYILLAVKSDFTFFNA